MTLYDILNVSQKCSFDEIRAGYYKLAREYHPDKAKDDSVKNKFLEIQEAYSILSDPTKRQHYDEEIEGRQILNDFSTLFNCFRENRDLKKDYDVNLDICEYLNGKTEKLKIVEKVACKYCNESGIHDYMNNVKSCSNCNGVGVDKNIPIFACGVCNGRGYQILKNAKCKSCKGEGKVTENSEIIFEIPKYTKNSSKLSKGKYIINISHDFDNEFDECGNLIINKDLDLFEWLLGKDFQVVYGNKIKTIKNNSIFDLSVPYNLENKVIMKCKLVITNSHIRSLNKCKPIFKQLFEREKSS